MKRNFKNIVIQDPLESNPIKTKPIIQTTIINSPKIISSKNHLIIKQYINTNEQGQSPKGNYLYHRNINTENKINNFKGIFKDKAKMVYHKQGLNHNINKNDNSLLSNTLSLFKRKKNIVNNNKNDNNITNYRKNNNNLQITEIIIPNYKNTIESYNYIYPKQNINQFDNNINISNNNENQFNQAFKKPAKIEKNVKIYENAELFSNEELENNKNNRNKNISILNYDIDKEKSKTFEKIENKKYKKRIYNYNNNNNISNNISNNINNNNELNNNKSENNKEVIKTNPNEISLYIKKYPFQKQIYKNISEKKDYYPIKNTYYKYREKNSLMIDTKDKIENQTFKTNPKYQREMFKRNIILESIKEYNNNQKCKKIVLLDKKKEEENNNIHSLNKNQHNSLGDHLSSPCLENELNDSSSDNFMIKNDNSISYFDTLKKNNSLPKTSFRFLINKAMNDKQFGDSFHQSYETNKNLSIEKSIERIKNKNDKSENDITDKSITYKNEENENNGIKNIKKPKNIDLNKFLKSKKSNNNILMNNLKIIKNQKNNNDIQDKSYNKKTNENEESNDNSNFSKTFENFKYTIKNNSSLLNLIKNKSNDIILESNNKHLNNNNQEPIEKNEQRSEFVIVSSTIEPKNYSSSLVNVEYLYNFENKILALTYKIKKYQVFEDEAYDLINYYFKNDISKQIIQLFNGVYYKNIIISYNKTELLCYFLCYDVCFYNSFEQVILLIKSIVDLLHDNFLLLLIYIIKENKNNSINFSLNKMNNTIVYYLENIIKQNINTRINNDEINEGTIIKMIMKNVVEINKYYKLIIDNVYQSDYLNNNELDNNLKFPYCLRYMNNSRTTEIFNNNKQLIISSFFIESYQLLNNYSIFDLENFFYSVLDKTNINLYKKNTQYILPKIDNNKYKYTLVLDLDETLIHCDRKTNNGFILLLRPGLIEFLQKMKNLCELILFSFGTSGYVDSIIKVIEKKEKFFEYILDRNHGIYENGECIKNLDMLNRDLKNVIIIDDTFKYFKLHKENGICVKPFYGDIENDNNTLIVLGNILEKIFFDANNSGDIRISLKKYKKLLKYSNILNNSQ